MRPPTKSHDTLDREWRRDDAFGAHRRHFGIMPVMMISAMIVMVFIIGDALRASSLNVAAAGDQPFKRSAAVSIMMMSSILAPLMVSGRQANRRRQKHNAKTKKFEGGDSHLAERLNQNRLH